MFGSETASCISSRGEYFFPVSNNKAEGQGDFQMSSYDLYAPPWATPPDWEFKGQDAKSLRRRRICLDRLRLSRRADALQRDMSNLLNFTDPAEKARDAKGTEALGKSRCRRAVLYFGIVDLAGFPKDRFIFTRRAGVPISRWRTSCRIGTGRTASARSRRCMFILPATAELFLNGKSLGLKKKGPLEYRLRWDDVVYQPGELKVVAYKNGKKWATDVMKTTGPAAKLTLQADRAKIKPTARICPSSP
jgi:beta-galactosidase